MEERCFRGIWIPADIWLDEGLTALDKIILSEIDSLDNEGGCTASNKYLADFCGCSESKIKSSISKLKKQKLVEEVAFDGRVRILKSCIGSTTLTNAAKKTSRQLKNDRQTYKKNTADCQKLTDDTLLYNNIEYYNNKDTDKKRFRAPSYDEVKTYCNERQNNIDAQAFIDYYTSNGWKVGKNPMKDWKAAVRTWERNERNGKETKDAKTISNLADKFGGVTY